MAAKTLSPALIKDLRERHVRFLTERLVSEQAREDWIRAFRNGYDGLLAVRIRDVVDANHLAEGFSRALTADGVRDFFSPVAQDLHRRVIASLRADTTELGDYVPEEARAAIDAILGDPDLVPEALVRKIFEQPLVQGAIHDTMYDGLMQFQTTVNPFFADWGLPAILKNIPFGGGLILSSMEALRGDFDRRLEPEIRKFLTTFSRRATGEMAELVLTKSGNPKFVALRRDIVSFLYSLSVSELVAGLDDDTATQAGLAAQEIVAAWLQRDDSSGRIANAITDFLQERGEETFGEWFDSVGAVGRPNPEEWAQLLWPLVAKLLGSSLFSDYLQQLMDEFYDSLQA